MRRRLRIDVAKGEHVLVLEYLGAGDLAAQNAGEDVGAVVGHRARPDVMGFVSLCSTHPTASWPRFVGWVEQSETHRSARYAISARNCWRNKSIGTARPCR